MCTVRNCRASKPLPAGSIPLGTLDNTTMPRKRLRHTPPHPSHNITASGQTLSRLSSHCSPSNGVSEVGLPYLQFIALGCVLWRCVPGGGVCVSVGAGGRGGGGVAEMGVDGAKVQNRCLESQGPSIQVPS